MSYLAYPDTSYFAVSCCCIHLATLSRELCGHLAGCHWYVLEEIWGKTLHRPASPSNIITSLFNWLVLTCFCVLSLLLVNLMQKHWCFWMQPIKKVKQTKKSFLLQEHKSVVYQTAWHFCVWGIAHLSTLFSCLHEQLALTVRCPNKISFTSLNRSWFLNWNGRRDESWPH